MPNAATAIPSPVDDTAAAERFFRRAFVASALLKLALAVLVPFTTDEAYFVLWGRNLDYGYYDHGAMTGWWLWLMLQFGDGGWLMRLPAVLVGQFVGWSLWRMLRPIDTAKAAWAATLFLVSPINVFSFLITTDTPLLFFSVIAVWFTFRGVRGGRLRDYFVAGLALGFAFLSKYFAVLLGVSFALLLLGCVGRPRVRELAVLLLGIVPGVGINVAWNYHHSWTNVLFNLITRQEGSGWALVPPLAYVAMLLALAGPGIWIAVLRRRTGERETTGHTWRQMRANGTVVFAVAFGFPLVAFFLVALTHSIGVHWVLSFFPFLSAVIFAFFRADAVRRMIRPTLVYTAIPAVAALATPLVLSAAAHKHRSAFSLVLALDPQAVLQELAPYRPHYVLTTPSYAKSALLGYHDRSNVSVIGLGSFHGRQDDLLTDFRAFDGRDVMIVTNRRRDLEACAAWFERMNVKEHSVQGARFYVLLGDKFDFATYRRAVLQEIADRYYRMPPWLQQIAAPSFFLERYQLEPRPLSPR